MSETCPWIISTSPATFEQDVLQRSKDVLVVLDFWAPWCGPCRLLGPLLEKLAREKNGAFVLVKVNTDEMPELAAVFHVQGIPTVFALRDGRVIDYFTGALPESELRAWLDQLLPQEDEALVAQGDALADRDPRAAEAKYREAISRNPKSIPGRIALARLLAKQKRYDEAKSLLNELSDLGATSEEVEKLRAELELANSGEQIDLQSLQAQVAANPGDFDLRLKYARALAAALRYEEALEEALRLVQTAQGDPREEARKLMLQIFSILGATHPLTEEYRRRLTMALF